MKQFEKALEVFEDILAIQIEQEGKEKNFHLNLITIAVCLRESNKEEEALELL